jgi:hypothetical protein
MTQTLECDCPYCPLIAADVQACNVYVKMFDDGHQLGHAIQCPKHLKKFSEDFFTLALYARNNCKLKIGNAIDISREGCKCNVEHVEKDIFMICFHALHGSGDDPLAMD